MVSIPTKDNAFSLSTSAGSRVLSRFLKHYKMQSRITHLCVLAVFFTIKTRAQLTYGVDASCNGKIDGVMEEDIYMHGRAATRMSMTNPSDNNQAQVFRWLPGKLHRSTADHPRHRIPNRKPHQHNKSRHLQPTCLLRRRQLELRYRRHPRRALDTHHRPDARERQKKNSERTPGVDQGFDDQLNDMRIPLPPDNTDWQW